MIAKNKVPVTAIGVVAHRPVPYTEECASIPAFRMFALDAAARKHRLAGRDVIFLTLGKSDLPLHPDIITAMKRAIGDPRKSDLVFPGGLPELRQALANRYSDLAGETVSSDRILVDAGTSSLYPSLLHMLGATGHEVLIPRPHYPLYRIAALLTGASVVYYDIDLCTMRIDLESIGRRITGKTRIVVVNSPGNPLGNIVTRKEMQALLRLLPDTAFLVFDEIYENTIFGTEAPLAPMLLRSSASCSARIVITNSCSKSYRMYTKRVGWCVVPHWLSGAMLALLQHTRLTVDPCVQYGAVEALRRDEEVDTLRATHEQRWKYARQKLSHLSTTRLLPSEGGFYCTLDCSEYVRRYRLTSDSALAMDVLERVGVAAVPGEDFGLPGALRLSFTSSRFEDAVDRLEDYFSDSRARRCGHAGSATRSLS